MVPVDAAQFCRDEQNTFATMVKDWVRHVRAEPQKTSAVTDRGAVRFGGRSPCCPAEPG